MSAADHLLRDLAPIPTNAWKVIDEEARQRLTPLLAARRVVEWVGAGGWKHDATGLGRTTDIAAAPAGITVPGVQLRQRRVLPLAEVRVPFTVSRREIEDIQRGAADPEFDDLDRAARASAEIENRSIFHGWSSAGMVGMSEACPHPVLELGDECEHYPTAVAQAVDRLRLAGVVGPYALAIGPAGYTRIIETTERGGYLLLDHLARILGGPVIWAPGVTGAVVLSQRGGDFLLDVGQDLSVGYADHDSDTVQLYLEESFSFRVAGPDAALILG